MAKRRHTLASLRRKPQLLALNPALISPPTVKPPAPKPPPGLAPSAAQPAPPAPVEWQCVKYTIPGAPMGKPRMTRADKWKKRDCVLRYRAWADKARAATVGRPATPIRVDILAFLPMPPSWSLKQKIRCKGTLHTQRPDYDNIGKCLGDSLWQKNDSFIACGYIEKRWEDDQGPRMELTIWFIPNPE